MEIPNISSDEPSTISDFSQQWTTFTDNTGYFASEEILVDHFGPLATLKEFEGKRVAEIGSGNGRFLKILASRAAEVVGIEPSEAIEISRLYTKDLSNVTYVKSDIYEITDLDKFDILICLGVLHHLVDPVRALQQMKKLLKPGGRAIIWVYGKEGNGTYLFFVKALRFLTVKLPHKALVLLSHILAVFVSAYIFLCKFLPLPMKRYFLNVLGKCDKKILVMNIYDQLNPRIANYWSKDELQKIFTEANLVNLKFFHRHGYSWTVACEKSLE